MRKPFDIKYRPQIEAGEFKVETRNGESVRIICWDKQGKYPIVVVSCMNGDEGVYTYQENGQYVNDESRYDLFIITPEEELTEFEQEVSDIVEYCKEHGEHVAFDYAKRHAKTLLALAEKEIAKGHEHDVYIPEDTYYEQLKKQWEEGYDKGKVEALKDLPRWEPNQVSYSEEPVLCNGNTILNLGWVHIHIDQLKKLPGFKEDEQ